MTHCTAALTSILLQTGLSIFHSYLSEGDLRGLWVRCTRAPPADGRSVKDPTTSWAGHSNMLLRKERRHKQISMKASE